MRSRGLRCSKFSLCSFFNPRIFRRESRNLAPPSHKTKDWEIVFSLAITGLLRVNCWWAKASATLITNLIVRREWGLGSFEGYLSPSGWNNRIVSVAIPICRRTMATLSHISNPFTSNLAFGVLNLRCTELTPLDLHVPIHWVGFYIRWDRFTSLHNNWEFENQTNTLRSVLNLSWREISEKIFFVFRISKPDKDQSMPEVGCWLVKSWAPGSVSLAHLRYRPDRQGTYKYMPWRGAPWVVNGRGTFCKLGTESRSR